MFITPVNVYAWGVIDRYARVFHDGDINCASFSCIVYCRGNERVCFVCTGLTYISISMLTLFLCHRDGNGIQEDEEFINYLREQSDTIQLQLPALDGMFV